MSKKGWDANPTPFIRTGQGILSCLGTPHYNGYLAKIVIWFSDTKYSGESYMRCQMKKEYSDKMNGQKFSVNPLSEARNRTLESCCGGSCGLFPGNWRQRSGSIRSGSAPSLYAPSQHLSAT